MVRAIDLTQVQELLESGAQLVDVMPPREYGELHLKGAINIPIKRLNRQTVAKLDRERAVIVYCHDYQWDMSPRAAARLETLGFKHVYDYVAGKADWLANGLPVEGEQADAARASTLVRTGGPTCRLDEPVQAIQARMKGSGWDMCAVIDADELVLGLLHDEQTTAGGGGMVEEHMEDGPSTFRPDASLKNLLDYLERNDRTAVLITTNRGRLIGAVAKDDLQRAAGEENAWQVHLYYNVDDERVPQLIELARGVIADNALAIVACTRRM